MTRLADRLVAAALYRVRERAQRHDARLVLAQCAEVGTGTRIRGRVRCTGAGNLRLGDNVIINDNANIRAEGGLTIGSNTHIARNLVVYTINHRYEGERLPYDEVREPKPVTIGKNVWIGTNVCIAPGTVIGDGAVIAMGTVVSGVVPPLAVIGTAGWRQLRSRDAERYERLEAAGRYGGPDGAPMGEAGRATGAG